MTDVTSTPTVPFRAAHLFPPVSVDLQERPDGSLLLRTTPIAAQVPDTLAQVLMERGRTLGDKPFMARRGADGEWEYVTFAQAQQTAVRIGSWLLGRDRADERVLIVTGNSLEHALLSFGAAFAGVPVCPVSAQYSLNSGGEYGRLRHVVDALCPTLVFADRVGPIREALQTVLPQDVTVVCTDPENWEGAIAWTELTGHTPIADPAAQIASLSADLPLRYMLTSGSTGLPKLVIQTNRMWCSLFVGANEVLAEASGWGVRTLDWMPWSHVAGLSVLIGALVNGGTYYIDDGRPTPELFATTLRNIADVQPLFFANVPYAFAMLCDAIEADAALRERFFEHLQLCLYGGAGLPQPVYDRFQAMAEQTIGERVMFTTGYGSTETTAGVMSISWPTTQVGVGLPLPGIELKLVPLEAGRYEVRFRAACVMPGYLDNPQASAAVFDDEGFYRSGDSVAFHDPERPEEGLRFAGRLAEEFKLTTGTFVPGGRLRDEVLAHTSPVVSEVLVCGEGYDQVGVLVWLNPAGVRAVVGVDGSPEELAADPQVTSWLAGKLTEFAGAGHGRSASIARFGILVEPPQVDAGELSDKGSLNQSITLRRRSADVAALYESGHPLPA